MKRKLYAPKYFRKENSKQIFEFIKETSFATIISAIDGIPMASHIPIELSSENGKEILTGHFSKANHQARALKSNQNVLVVFLGADHYVSSGWYSHENVPTWNYVAVQVRGSIELIDERDKLLELLGKQIEKYEDSIKGDFKMSSLSEDFLTKELRGIIGFKILISSLEAAYKLSQNRNKIDYENVIKKLREINTPSSKLIASEMHNEYLLKKDLEN